ncbi:hypothetical protein PsYK624_049840 [Phanerochaete sordida]|uniref:Uncharacterized protein n=1 Tax=Phanerochaete sordida TaxID=48140 RepID=A0A9P3G5Z6_9APHY|nr:hypothetical protein PsYK624_049840 [Phanerochaete sordida]
MQLYTLVVLPGATALDLLGHGAFASPQFTTTGPPPAGFSAVACSTEGTFICQGNNALVCDAAVGQFVFAASCGSAQCQIVGGSVVCE